MLGCASLLIHAKNHRRPTITTWPSGAHAASTDLLTYLCMRLQNCTKQASRDYRNLLLSVPNKTRKLLTRGRTHYFSNVLADHELPITVRPIVSISGLLFIDGAVTSFLNFHFSIDSMHQSPVHTMTIAQMRNARAELEAAE